MPSSVTWGWRQMVHIPIRRWVGNVGFVLVAIIVVTSIVFGSISEYQNYQKTDAVLTLQTERSNSIANLNEAVKQLAAAQAKGAATAKVIGVYAAELAGQLQTICGDFATMAVALHVELPMCPPLYAVDANGNKISSAP